MPSFPGQRLYTSVPAKLWRVLPVGERVDKAFPFKGGEAAARASWKTLVRHITAK